MIKVDGEKKTAKQVARDAVFTAIGGMMDTPWRNYSEEAFEKATPKEQEAMTKAVTDYANRILKMIQMDLHYEYGDSIPTENEYIRHNQKFERVD